MGLFYSLFPVFSAPHFSRKNKEKGELENISILLVNRGFQIFNNGPQALPIELKDTFITKDITVFYVVISIEYV